MELIKKLEKDIKFINDGYSNFKELILLSNDILNINKSFDQNYDKIQKTNLTEEEIIILAREIINSISNKYAKEFDNLIDNKKIKIYKFTNKLDRNGVPKCPSEYVIKKNYNDNYIKLVRRYTYNDVVDLVHEFMHHTNTDVINDDKIQDKYSEFISIYFEFYAIKYLINKKKINKDKLDSTWRFRSVIDVCCNNFMFLPFLMQEEYNDLSYASYKNIISKYDLKFSKDKTTYKYAIIELKQYLNEMEIIHGIKNGIKYIKKDSANSFYDDLEEIVFLDNRYLYGIIYTFLLQDINRDIIVMFNDYLKNNKIKKSKEAFEYVLNLISDLTSSRNDLIKNIFDYYDKYAYVSKKSKILKTNV